MQRARFVVVCVCVESSSCGRRAEAFARMRGGVEAKAKDLLRRLRGDVGPRPPPPDSPAGKSSRDGCARRAKRKNGPTSA